MRPQQKLDVRQAAEHEPKNHHQALAFPLPVLMILLCRAAHSDPRRLEGHPRVGPWRERRQRQQRQLWRRQGENARGSWAAGAQHQGAHQQHQRQLQRDMGQVLKMKRITKENMTQLFWKRFWCLSLFRSHGGGFKIGGFP